MSSEPHTILLVDDNDDLREVTKELLEAMGHQVLGAPRAEAAARLFERRASEIEVLICEIVLAGLDGMALADRLRAAKPSLGVLLISTHDNHRDLRRRVEGGELEFLRKPYSAEELAVNIDRALSDSMRWQAARDPAKRSLLPVEPVAPGMAPAGAPTAPSASRGPKRRRVLWLSTAAGLVGFAVLALIRLVGLQPPALPARVPDSATRSLVIEPISPRGEIRSTPQELHWRPVEAADRYEVSLLGVDGSLLWQGSTTRSTISLPGDIRMRVQQRVLYFWQVDAFSEEGLRLSGSERVRFLVGAPFASEGDFEPPS